MADNLRHRIAAALQGASDDGFSAEDWLFLADAVIAETDRYRREVTEDQFLDELMGPGNE